MKWLSSVKPTELIVLTRWVGKTQQPCSLSSMVRPITCPPSSSQKRTRAIKGGPRFFPKRVTDNLWRSTEVNMVSITQKALEALKLSEISVSRRFRNASDETRSAMIVLLAYSQGKRRIAELRRVLPLSLDSLLSAKYLAQKRGWLTDTGALTAAGQKTIRTLRREGRKFL